MNTEAAAAEIQRFLIAELAQRLEIDPERDRSTATIRTIWSGFAQRVEAGSRTGSEDRPETSDHGAVGLSVD